MEKVKQGRTYFTKKELIMFGEYMVSDSRKQRLHAELVDKVNRGVKNPTPVVTMMKQVHESDLIIFKEMCEELRKQKKG